MKKFFSRTSEERGRRKKEELALQDEQDILHGRKALGSVASGSGSGGGASSERSLLDPRGMMKKKNSSSSSRRIVINADVVPASASASSANNRHFIMAEYTMRSHTNLSSSSPPQSPPSVAVVASGHHHYSPSNNPLSAKNNSSSTNSAAISGGGGGGSSSLSSYPNKNNNNNSGASARRSTHQQQQRQRENNNKNEDDKSIKQRLKEERMHYKSQNSNDGSSSSSSPRNPHPHPHYSTTTSSNSNSRNVVGTTMQQQQQQRSHTASSSIGGASYVSSLSYDDDDHHHHGSEIHHGLHQQQRTTTVVAVSSQEEKDKRAKERIKQQRKAASSSIGASLSVGCSSSSYDDDDDDDDHHPLIIRHHHHHHDGVVVLNKEEGNSGNSRRGGHGGSGHQSSSSLRELSSHTTLRLQERGGNNREGGGGGGLNSAMKGSHRYNSDDGGGSNKKNQGGDDDEEEDDEEEEERQVSFGKTEEFDYEEEEDEEELFGEEERRRGGVSFELEGNKARPKEVDDFNESDFNLDDCNDAIMASARQFGGPDYEDEQQQQQQQQQQQLVGRNYSAEEELRRSNLIDLHMAQFMATSQRGGSDDFDPSELKQIYHESLGGVEEDDDEGEEESRHRSKQHLSHFEEEEFKKNMKRRMSRRLSKTSMRIDAWHQKYSLRMALRVANRTPEMEWLSSFYRSDPRWQIQAFFDEVAREGGDAQWNEDLASSPLALLFNKATVFTVWRPTSDEAIKNMMLGIATGKGLDIKGKSAKKGNISSYVPFVQIYEEQHKEHVRAFLKDGRTIRVFYQSEASRNEAHEMILDIKDFMLFAAQDAMRILSDEYADEAEQELAMKHLMYDDTNVRVTLVDTYAQSNTPVFGLDITERLFWESYVMMQDCSRPAWTEWDIGRKSEPTFMDFNFKSLRKQPGPGEPRAVVYQFAEDSPMEPRTLLMAYEEHNLVKPVVSDFDCFLLGSRGVKYKDPVPPDQVELVKWSVKNISEVLDERAASRSDSGWMADWFKVLKKAAMRNYVPITPKYGNGDPKSYEIIEVAVSRLQGTGCVRHGAECFNWYFPQEIDDEFLVISDTLPGKVKWKKMNVFELQEILMTKIDEGFTFPINPKWVLCDPGWRRVYDKLLASQKPNVQDSINCWLPPETGLREQIDAISKRHPHGFEGRVYKVEGTEVMDKMEEELERYRRVQALWRKARGLVWWIIFLHRKSRTKRLEEAMQQRK